MKRRLRKLRRRTLRQANREYHKRGTMSEVEWQSVQAVCSSERGLEELQRRIDMARMNPWDGPSNLSGDWREVLANIWDWFVANWPAILEFIITIAPLLLLEPNKYEDS